MQGKLENIFFNRPRGPMDKASVFGTEDCRFESYRGQFFVGNQMNLLLKMITNYMSVVALWPNG